ncbi:MAG TPA: ATP-binding protein, partial [Ruminiclostridium sp.]
TEMQISNNEAITYRLKEHIVERFFKAQLDTVFVASYLGNHLKNNSSDSYKEIERVKVELNNVIPSLINVNSIFFGISYIDRNGDESVNMNAKGFAGKSQLEKAIKDNCFQKTSEHKTGEIYTTFDSNLIYICAPVYDSFEEFSGVIIMVVNEDELLSELLPLISKGDIILMEDTGKYILASAKHNGKENLLDEYPDSLFSNILSSQSGNLVYDKNTILTYIPVDLDDRQWFLLLGTDKESTTALFSALYEKLIIVLTLAILAIIAAIVLWLRSDKKDQIAKQERMQNKQLENINEQLQGKQYSLEEQNSVIEELNSQLEDENTRFIQQKETLQAIIDSLGAGIMMVDVEDKVMFINKAWKDLFNYLDFGDNFKSHDDFYINRDTCCNAEEFIQDIMAGMENRQEPLGKLVDLLQDSESRYTVDLEQTDPIKRFLNLYSNPCISHANCSFGRVFVARDISHQKEVDRLKLELISTVSHELRTPMSSILGFSELLLTRKLTEERSKEYISIINSEARRLTNLINDFLDIQRMESGKHIFNKQFNSMNQIIEEAVKLFENTNDKYKIIYDKNTENIPCIYCDRDKILQVLSNLLSNAIKYSPYGGKVKVYLTMENGKAKISVTDYGLGIPDDVRDKLFTKFFRVDNDDRREIGGSGLGLAICKEIIRAHGGEIDVESIYGQGSTFYFTLPYSDISTNNELAETNNSCSTTGNKGNLLIVEDDVSMVKLIKEILKDEGLEMHDVSSGEEALKFVAIHRYKLIILDIALSGQMSGWDVLKELKKNQTTVDTPIIISSVYENKDIASQNGIADYLVKPFEPGQLIKMAHKASNGKLNSKMMVKSDDGLTEIILEMLSSRKIGVKQIEHSGNILIITLDGEEGHEDE